MFGSVLPFSEESGGFDDYGYAQVFPGKIARVPFRKDFNLCAIDDDRILCGLHIGLEYPENRVVFQQMSQGFGICDVIDRKDFDIRILVGCTQKVSAYSSESVYSDFMSHARPPLIFSLFY